MKGIKIMMNFTNKNNNKNKGENTMNNTYEGNNTKQDYNIKDIINVIGQTTQIVQSTSESTSVMMIELNNQKKILGGLTTTITDICSGIGNLTDRMSNIELSEEITTSQNENIQRSVKRRLFEILNGDEVEVKKYYKIFAQRLYSSARKNAGMGSSLARTRKRDYQRVLDYVEAWTPSNGCSGLKAEADSKAVARLIAKQQGYDC